MRVEIVDLATQQANPVLCPLQAFRRAHDADVVPHEATQFVPVVRDDDFLVGIADPAGVPFRQRRQIAGRLPEDVRRRGLGKDEAFEEGIAGQPVGAVQAGA
ncbi:MAG: hypothetical protein AW07_04231 [Candidatus Accumulibacter sp. SK-11]|nr:MAG: hypothetical protein AW07_04231 [Candidatus Accumulibacter sp. SK-11]